MDDPDLDDKITAALVAAGLDPAKPPERVAAVLPYLMESIMACVPVLNGVAADLKFIAVFFRTIAEECDAEAAKEGAPT